MSYNLWLLSLANRIGTIKKNGTSMMHSLSSHSMNDDPRIVELVASIIAGYDPRFESLQDVATEIWLVIEQEKSQTSGDGVADGRTSGLEISNFR
jgi:hypothetical protein